jgi:hypothetical protein
MLFEGIGLGCGSGPLTGRYLPPMGASLYFLRPGTTKLPLFLGAPVIGDDTRSWLDVGVYATGLFVLTAALVSPAVTPWHLVPLLFLVPAMGVLDKTLFLVHRSEHYLSVVVCLLFSQWWIEGAKWVWMAIWLGAATSKINRHFPAVICVMTSNAPFTLGTPLRRWVYRDFPNDLRPSAFASRLAHFGTVTEVLFPVLLLVSDGGWPTAVGLFVITGFHLFILVNVPMGVPLEWNVVMVYGAFVLFGVHAGVPAWELGAPLLVGWLVFAHVVVPVFGSVYPHRVSFLLAHRYYAGNWPYSVWLFREGSQHKLEALTKWSPMVHDQLGVLYDERTSTALVSKVMGFRLMHLLGGALRDLVPIATDGDLRPYQWLDGELVTGMVVGWNFGDGHLGGPQLLDAVQRQCGFAPGELRCIFVESQGWLREDADWEIRDAATGLVDRGRVTVKRLQAGQPWSADA